jgi:hypothetical protein
MRLAYDTRGFQSVSSIEHEPRPGPQIPRPLVRRHVDRETVSGLECMRRAAG